MKPIKRIATRLETRDSIEMVLFTTPAALFVLGVFVAPLLFIALQSVSDPSGNFSFASYARITSHPAYARITWITFQICSLATVFALLLAYPLAYYLARQSPTRRAVLTTLVLIPFWTSVLVKSFAFVVILGRSGVLNTILGRLGISPVKLMFNRLGVVVGMTHYLVCFMVFPIMTNLIAQPRELRYAAAIMGAGPWRIFWRVTLPLSLPAMLSGSVMVFIVSLGFYIVPELLGGIREETLSNLIEFYASEAVDWPMACALSVLLASLAMVAVIALSLLPGATTILGESKRS